MATATDDRHLPSLLGVVALSNRLRSDAQQMVGELKANNTNTVLLSGDYRQSAEHLASAVGIIAVHAELLPAQKVEKIRENQIQCSCPVK